MSAPFPELPLEIKTLINVMLAGISAAQRSLLEQKARDLVSSSAPVSIMDVRSATGAGHLGNALGGQVLLFSAMTLIEVREELNAEMQKPADARELEKLARLQYKYTQILQMFSQLLRAEQERMDAALRNMTA